MLQPAPSLCLIPPLEGPRHRLLSLQPARSEYRRYSNTLIREQEPHRQSPLTQVTTWHRRQFHNFKQYLLFSVVKGIRGLSRKFGYESFTLKTTRQVSDSTVRGVITATKQPPVLPFCSRVVHLFGPIQFCESFCHREVTQLSVSPREVSASLKAHFQSAIIIASCPVELLKHRRHPSPAFQISVGVSSIGKFVNQEIRESHAIRAKFHRQRCPVSVSISRIASVPVLPASPTTSLQGRLLAHRSFHPFPRSSSSVRTLGHHLSEFIQQFPQSSPSSREKPEDRAIRAKFHHQGYHRKISFILFIQSVSSSATAGSSHWKTTPDSSLISITTYQQ